MDLDLRLRGPWLIRGILLDTSISSQSGTISSDSMVKIPLSPYTFFPGLVHNRLLSFVTMRIPIELFGSAEADAPDLVLYTPAPVSADYESEWRHINP